jgi:predicted phage terminase large subunit-like protein
MVAQSAEEWDGNIEEFKAAMASLTEEEFQDYLDSLPAADLQALLRETAAFDSAIPDSPIDQAMELDPKYVVRPHLQYLSDRLKNAVEDVKNGINRKIMVSMPPRTGKSEMISRFFPVWLLRINSSWKITLLSYAPVLARGWSLSIRRVIEQHGVEFGVQVARDAGAIEDWQTTEQGELHARSIGQGITGLGANVMIIDDPFKDSVSAHQKTTRETVWKHWTNDFQSRLEQPYLVIVVQTRWHEDDLMGRLQDPEQEGAVPEDWEIISFPAIATIGDVLGREPGDPLFPPLVEMIKEKALAWWASLQRGMSSYNWAAMYQQSPSPSQGAIFNVDWWHYWTRDPTKVSGQWVPRLEAPGEGLGYEIDREADMVWIPDGVVVLLPDMANARLTDSWDLNFDDTIASDFVVGQRWGALSGNHYLLDQRRGRWDFPRTLEEFKDWNSDGLVHKHLVEKKANGAAMISSLKGQFDDIDAVNPTASKEVRARATTATIEHGHVFLPLPEETPWMERDKFMDEFRDFPSGVHDDQVDVLTQYLNEFNGGIQMGGVSIPAQVQAQMKASLERRGTAGTTGAPTSPYKSPLTTKLNRSLSGGRPRT